MVYRALVYALFGTKTIDKGLSIMNDKNRSNAVYIDFRIVCNLLKRKLFSLILAGVIGGLLFGAVGYITYTPTYSSTVSLIVHAEETTTNQLTAYDVTYSEKLINTLEVFLKHNKKFREQLSNMAGTNKAFTDDDILKMMNISQIKTSTPTMNVTFTSTNKNAAYNLAKSFELLVNGELERLNVNVGSVGILNSAAIADFPDNSNPAFTYAIIGFLVAFTLLYIVFLVKVIFDTKIHKEEDISELFDYPLLGSVPSIYRGKKGRSRSSGYGGYGHGKSSNF